ncbi:MAG: hypothetical protein GVY31_03070 [Alphaproteobacteria bacterium]|jgi:uncharacterized membrane protein YccC|nr:hypothetical protein [Alphaproteobacteria bacterium]
MPSNSRFFETFDLALGRLIALLLGAIGGFLVYFALHVWGDTATLVTFGIGLVLLFIAGIMLYYRVPVSRVLEFFGVGSWWG